MEYNECIPYLANYMEIYILLRKHKKVGKTITKKQRYFPFLINKLRLNDIKQNSNFKQKIRCKQLLDNLNNLISV